MAAKPQAGAPIGRLTRASEFEALRRGKGVSAKFGRLRGVKRASGDEMFFALRFGLVVPKKLGNAPQRNRIKRRLREGLRLARLSGCFERKGISARTGVDIGVFPSASVIEMRFETLVTELCASVAALMRKLEPHPI
jgi:ribonuclease P protein component